MYACNGADVHEVGLCGDEVLVVDKGALCPVVGYFETIGGQSTIEKHRRVTVGRGVGVGGCEGMV